MIEETLRLGIVEPSSSSCSSLILLDKKQDGSYRFCVNFSKLNFITVRNSHSLPLVSDTFFQFRLELHVFVHMDEIFITS